MGTELNWGSPSATDVVQKIGRKVGDMKTQAGNNYTIYKYDGFTVQIHADDNEMILVMKGDKVIWVHPRDEEKLRRMVATAYQQKAAPTNAEQARKISEQIRRGGRR